MNDIENSFLRGREAFLHVNPFVPAVYLPGRSERIAAKIANYTPPAPLRDTRDAPHPLLIGDVKPDTTAGVNSLMVLPDSNPDSNKNEESTSRTLAVRREPPKVPEPTWHAPWELSAVISGHLGWVRSLAFDASNEWFVTGSADRTIKVWDLAKCCAGAEGGLKLTLTGHINAVRGLAVSPRHPYLFSCGEDKMVKCWDLEYNKVIRHYHGHLSAVYALSLHPTLDILITGGRDSVARVWDIRTKQQIHVLAGHSRYDHFPHFPHYSPTPEPPLITLAPPLLYLSFSSCSHPL